MADSFSRTISIYVDSGAAQESYDKLAKTQDDLTAKIKKYTDAGKEIPENLTKKLESVTDALDRQNKKLTGELSPSYKDLTATVARLNNEVNRGSKEDAGYAKKVEQLKEAKEAADQYRESVIGIAGAMEGAKHHGEGFMETVKGIAAGMGLVEFAKKAGESLKEFFGEAVKEAMELEKSQMMLRNALDNVGRTDALEKLNAQAEEYSQKFSYLYTPEITKVQEKLVTFGRLSINEINKLLPVIINFSAHTQKSMEESATTILSAMEGNGRALKQFGIEITKDAGFAVNFSKVMDQLGPRMEGAAANFDKMNASIGDRMQKSFKQLQETVGNMLMPVFSEVANIASRLVNNFREMIDVQEDETTSLKKMQSGMNENLTALQNQNLSAAARRDLIKETNEKYGSYLPNLLTEKSTLDEIKKAQEGGNKAFQMKIYMIAYQKEIQAALEEQLLAEKSITKNQEESAKRNNIASTSKLSAAELEKVNKMNEAMDKGFKQTSDNAAKTNEEINKSWKATMERMGVSWDEFQKMLEKPNPKDDKALRDDPDYNKPKHDKELTDYKKYLEDLKKLNLEAHNEQLEKNAKEIAELNQKFDEQFKLEKDFHDKLKTSDEEHERNLASINDSYTREAVALRKKQNEEAAAKQYEIALKGADSMYAALKEKAEADFRDGVTNKDEYEASIGEIEARHLQARTAIARTYASAVEKAKDDVVTFDAAAEKQITDNLLAELKRREDSEKRALEYEKQAANAKAQGKGGGGTDDKLKALEAWYEEKKKLAGTNEAELTALTADYQAQRDQIIRDGFKQTMQEVGQDIQKFGGELTQALSSIFKIMDQKEEHSLKQAQSANKAKLKSYEEELKKKQISQAQYDKMVEAANTQMAAQEEAEKKKKFQRDKELGIIKATISMATAIMNAVSESPMTGGLPGSAIAAAMGGIEIGVIASQKFAEGTASYKGTMGGRPHSAGGNPVIDGHTGRKIAELEQGEAIIPKDAVANNPALINHLLTTGRNKNTANTLHPVRQLNVGKNLANIRQGNRGIYSSDESHGEGGKGLSGDHAVSMLHEIHATLTKTHETLTEHTALHKQTAEKPPLSLHHIQEAERTQAFILSQKM